MRALNMRMKREIMTLNAARTVLSTLAVAGLSLLGSPGDAHAGKGVKLDFGYPLGSFVAHPSAKHAGKNAGQSRHRNYQAEKERRAAVRRAAAERAAERKRQAAARRQLAREREVARQKEIARQREIAKRSAAREAERLAEVEARRATRLAAAIPLPERAPVRGQRNATLAIADDKAPTKSTLHSASDFTTTLAASRVGREICERFVPGAGLTITVPCDEL